MKKRREKDRNLSDERKKTRMIALLSQVHNSESMELSRHDSSHRLVTSRTNSKSFAGGADHPTYWVSILLGRIAKCGMLYIIFWAGTLRPGKLIMLASLA